MNTDSEQVVEPYPEEILKLITIDGFIADFISNISATSSYIDAYELTENKHEKYFGKRKYNSFASFSVVRKRHYVSLRSTQN